MADPTKSPEALSQLLGAMYADLQRWRQTVRAGGVMRLSELSVLNNSTRRLDMEDLDRIAKAMNCNWAYNHKQHIVYFIPLELTGEQA